jgi:archaellum biogenesis ATPase FlaH
MIEQTILSHLAYNEEYSRKVLPFLKEEYFVDPSHKITFKLVDAYINKYNGLPSKEAILIELGNASGLNETGFKAAKEVVESLSRDETGMDWLIDTTEKFCQDKALYNAVSKSIQIMDGTDKSFDKGMIPKVLQDALAVTFDNSVGHDYLEDFDQRYDFYHRKEARLPFDLNYMNEITNGGIPAKTLNIILAGTGVGKTMFMCHCAAGNLTLGRNVLYITMEMAEEEIAKRIDANLMNVPLDELLVLPRETYRTKVKKVREKTVGKLLIKEYPTASASAHHFRALLNELALKKNFVPDIIYIDYLNICASSRIKPGANVNSYTYIKSIAEELRGLAVEFKLPIVSATQTTRTGYSSSDVELTDTSESFGLPATADFMIALISTEELADMGQIMVKQLKNRYGDPNKFKRFVIGVDRAKMKFYDVEQGAQENLLEGPVFDRTDMGRETNQSLKDKLKMLV